MLAIQPRSYQTEAVHWTWEYFRQGNTGNPVVAMPTGTGKSVVIAMFLESIFQQFINQKILVLTHVKELIGQNYEKLMTLWPQAPAGINSAGLNRRDTRQKIIFGGIGTVAKRAAEFGHVDLIIIDECHLVSPSDETMYQKFIAALKVTNPCLKIIGFTATPWRLGQGRITDDGIFTDICFDITTVTAFNRLIAEGYLAPLVPKATQTVLDTDGVHMRGGEFIPSELQNAVDKDYITQAALNEAREYLETRKHWLVFAAGVEHAIHIAEALNAMGIRAVAIHSKLSTAERDDAIAKFKSGYYTAAVNNNILTTGFDFPEIDLIVCLRPTQSTVLWVQMLGRGTRPAPWAGKENCLVLDFAGNTKRLGPINDPVIPRKKGEKGGEAPVKVCPACGCYVHASLRYCNGVHQDGSRCTHEFVFETKLKQGASTEELIRGDLPVVKCFKVEHITMTHHEKEGAPPMMRVTYFCEGNKSFQQHICVQHQGFAGKKAREWLREFVVSGELPKATDEAIERCEEYRLPTHIRVWTNKKYPEVLAFCWNGTAFGTQVPTEEVPTVDGDTSRYASSRGITFGENIIPKGHGKEMEFADDDIPF